MRHCLHMSKESINDQSFEERLILLNVVPSILNFLTNTTVWTLASYLQRPHNPTASTTAIVFYDKSPCWSSYINNHLVDLPTSMNTLLVSLHQ